MLVRQVHLDGHGRPEESRAGWQERLEERDDCGRLVRRAFERATRQLDEYVPRLLRIMMLSNAVQRYQERGAVPLEAGFNAEVVALVGEGWGLWGKLD
ncbi:MAG: hypothetical protein ACOC1F_04930 [Myxococcota bacterium]